MTEEPDDVKARLQRAGAGWRASRPADVRDVLSILADAETTSEDVETAGVAAPDRPIERRHGRRPWVRPLVAAACVAAVTLGVVLIVQKDRPLTASPPTTSTATPVSSTAAVSSAPQSLTDVDDLVGVDWILSTVDGDLGVPTEGFRAQGRLTVDRAITLTASSAPPSGTSPGSRRS